MENYFKVSKNFKTQKQKKLIFNMIQNVFLGNK